MTFVTQFNYFKKSIDSIILFSIDTVVIRAFIQSNIYLALKLETFHLHDKNRHSEVFAVWFYLFRFVYSPRCFYRIGSKTR